MKRRKTDPVEPGQTSQLIGSAGIDQSEEHVSDEPRVSKGLEQKAKYLQVINELALALLQKSTLDDILWLVARSAVANLGFEDCVIYLRDDTQQVLLQKAAHGPKNPADEEILNPIVIQIGEGIVGSVAATGTAEIVPDTTADERYIVDDAARHSELAVPIVHDGRVIGVIDSEHPDPHFYTEEHEEILTTIASMASTKIASAMTIERLNETVKQLESTENALRAGERRYRALYDSHPSMFFTVDDQGVVRSVNHFAAEQLGYAVGELEGKPISEIHLPEEVDSVKSRIDGCLRRPGELHRWETCKVCNDGSHIWVRETARVVDLDEREKSSILNFAITPAMTR